MKVKVIKVYKDKELGKYTQVGNVFEVTKERAELLIYKKLVVLEGAVLKDGSPNTIKVPVIKTMEVKEYKKKGGEK